MTTIRPYYTALFLFALTVFEISTIAFAEEHTQQHVHETSIHHSLKLNEGKPWLTDEHTAQVVNQMKNSLEQFLTEYKKPSLTELQAQGQKLKTQLDSLIQGCTMRGPAHDQLHQWLTKVIPEINHLQSANTKTEGVQTVAKLDALLTSYSTYFISP